MFVQQPISRLLSLLLVFLTENYHSEHGDCASCGTSCPRFDKVYLINGKLICIDCIVKRIEGHTQE